MRNRKRRIGFSCWGIFVCGLLGMALIFCSMWYQGEALAAFPSDPDLQYFAGDGNADTRVARVGEQFEINAVPTYLGRVWNGEQIEGLLLNARMVNGIYDDLDGSPPSGMTPWDAQENTKDYIAQMPSWRTQGLIAFSINFQGGSNRCHGLSGDGQSATVKNNPYGSSGTQAFDDWSANRDTGYARYLTRLGSIIRAADDLGMVVILGLFYFGQDELLSNEAAVQAAVDATTDWVLANKWTNVVIEINNEANLRYNHAILQPDRVHELVARVKTRSAGATGGHLPHGRLLVSTSGSGGYIPSNTWISNSDFVLLHGNGRTSSGIRTMVDQVRAKTSWQADPKPIVFNEDSTNTDNFRAALEKQASWGYFDSDGYQCVYSSTVTDRWTLSAATNPSYWPLLADITGADETALLPGAVVMEAEEMALLGGYRVESANPDWIMVAPTAVQGEATGTFAGPEDVYEISIHAIAEDDGRPVVELWVRGQLVATFTYPLGTTAREPIVLQGPTLSLHPGDQIKLIGFVDGTNPDAALARVDSLVFAPEGSSSAMPPSAPLNLQLSN